MKSSLVLAAFFFFFYTAKSQQLIPTHGYMEINIKYTGKSQLDLPPPPPPPPPTFGNNSPQTEGNTPTFEDEGFRIKVWFDTVFEKVENTLYGRTTFLFNSLNQSTITLQENFGHKKGYIATKEDQEIVEKYFDSLMNKKTEATPVTRVEYINESRIVNGFQCKKAFLLTERGNVIIDTAIIWYSPDYKLPNNFNFSTDKLEHKSRLAALKILNGLPIKVDISYTSKMRIELEVIKVDFKKVVSSKEFSIPKDFILSSIKEKYGLN